MKMVLLINLPKQKFGFLFFIYLLQMKIIDASTCSVRGQVPDIVKRSRTYQADGIIDSDPYVSDNYLWPGWYSAVTEDGGQYLMPDNTSIPKYLSCGTRQPVYLKEQHPNIDEMEEEKEISVTSCELYPYHNCLNTFDIQIRKCNNTIQYYLVETSSFSAYCFDPPEIQGETNLTDPLGVTIGSLTVSPELAFSERIDNGYTSLIPYLEFQCTESADTENQRPNIAYTTYWYIDHQLKFVFSSNESISKVTEQDLIGKGYSLGIHMRCGVKISNSTKGIKSPLTISDDFFAGIMVHDNVINMNRTDIYTMKFTQTVPFGCYGLRGEDLTTGACNHKVNMITSAENNCAIDDTNTGGGVPFTFDNQNRCGFEINGCYPPELTNSSCVTSMQDYSMTVTTQSFGNDFTPFYRVSLKTQNNGEHEIWKEYTLGNVNINVHDDIDINDKVCYSHVDPHMQTATGTGYDNNDDEGEFMLYWNIEYGIQVQEKTVDCGNSWNAFCTCAVAIRSGGDVFLINLCNDLKFIGMTSCKDSSLLIQKYSELEYQVQTNIGTLIKIRIRPNEQRFGMMFDNLMNIDIIMAPKDYQSIRGLCGLLDSDIRVCQDFHDRDGSYISKDNRQQFINEWRLRDSDTNFLTPTCKANVTTWYEENQRLFCLCNCTGERCNTLNSEATCSPSQYINCTVTDEESGRLCEQFTDRCQVENRKRRSAFIIDPEEEMKRKAKLSLRNKKNRVYMKREAEYEITKENATQMCMEKMYNTPAVTNYSALLGGYNIASFIQDCIYDVYETQDVGWISAHETAAKDAVQIGFKINSNFTLMHNEELLNFKRQYCPFNCSGNGYCTDDGICKCEAGYFGTDCRNDVTIDPEIEDVEGGGFCDTRYGSECQCFEIQTRNLAENFHCKRVHKQVLKNGSEQEIDTNIVSGSFKNLFMGECCFEPRRKRRSDETSDNVINNQYDVSISNDGIHFGSTSTLYIYDSTCLNINSENTDNITFEIKNNTCIIQGICYEDESTVIANDCFKCNAFTDKFNWTYSCVDSHTNEPDDENQISIMIPVTVSLCAGFLVVVAVCVVIKMKNRPRRTVSVSQQFTHEITREETNDSFDFDIRFQENQIQRFKPDLGNGK